MMLRCLLFGHRWFHVAEYDDALMRRGYQVAFPRAGMVALRRSCTRCHSSHRGSLPPVEPPAAAGFGQVVLPAQLPASAWAAEG